MYILSHDGKLDNAVHPACALIHTPAPVILRLWEILKLEVHVRRAFPCKEQPPHCLR